MMLAKGCSMIASLYDWAVGITLVFILGSAAAIVLLIVLLARSERKSKDRRES
jgi:hypothetical protein